MQDVPEHGPQVLEPPGQELPEVVVQERPILQDAAGQPGCQCRIPAVQPVFAHIALKEGHQTRGMGVFRGQIGGRQQDVPAAGGIAQDAIDQGRGVLLLFAVALGQIHGLIDGSGLGDLVQKQDLIQSQMEDIPEHRPQILQPPSQELLQIVVEERPVLQNAVSKAGGQGGIPAIQTVPGELLFEHAVGPAALGAAVFQHLKCGLSGGHIKFQWGGRGNSRAQPCACRPRPGAGGSR